MITYVVDGWFKHAELDNWEKGCDGRGLSYSGNDTFVSESVEGLITKLAMFVGIDSKENIILDSCDEAGRVDIQKMENDEGYTPSKSEFEDFKTGKRDLFAVTYTFYVKKIQEMDFSFEGEIDMDKVNI